MNHRLMARLWATLGIIGAVGAYVTWMINGTRVGADIDPVVRGAFATFACIAIIAPIMVALIVRDSRRVQRAARAAVRARLYRECWYGYVAPTVCRQCGSRADRLYGRLCADCYRIVDNM